ncbi:MAG: hypothetical protein ACR2RF_26245 [Geminicoccaceae bacterium]
MAKMVCPHGKSLRTDCIVCAKMFEIEDRLRKREAVLVEALTELCAAIRKRTGCTIAEGKALEMADKALADKEG